MDFAEPSFCSFAFGEKTLWFQGVIVTLMGLLKKVFIFDLFKEVSYYKWLMDYLIQEI